MKILSLVLLATSLASGAVYAISKGLELSTYNKA